MFGKRTLYFMQHFQLFYSIHITLDHDSIRKLSEVNLLEWDVTRSVRDRFGANRDERKHGDAQTIFGLV